MNHKLKEKRSVDRVKLTSELGFRVRFSSWIFELGFRVGFSSKYVESVFSRWLLVIQLQRTG